MTTFKIHTAETAPDHARELVKAVQVKMGLVPNVVGVMAESPSVLKGWLDLKADVESGLLSPLEREIVQMTVSYLNDCGYCVAAHTTIAQGAKMPADIIEALRTDKPLKDAKLEQLRQFTKAVMKRFGRPDAADIDAFRLAGYKDAHVLEVVSGLALATITNYINHIAQTPVDKAFEANRIEARKTDMRRSDAA